MKMVLQISKIVLKEDTCIGQLMHKVEVTQLDFVKKLSVWLESLWACIKSLFQSVIL